MPTFRIHQHLEDDFHTDPNLLKFPVALWGTTRGPLGLATLPAGCRLRAPWRCPVYPWASWCQVTGLQPSCSCRRMANRPFRSSVSGAEAGKFIGKQGLKLRILMKFKGWTAHCDFKKNVHHYIGVSKNRGVPKMDGFYNGKPY